MLNNELETITNELQKFVQNWKSNYKKCIVTKKKIRAAVKMLILYKSINSPTKDCEIPSHLVGPANPPIVVGSKNHIKKGVYAYNVPVAEKVVCKFEKNDPKLLELREEILFLKKISECEHILKVYVYYHFSF